MKKLLFTLGTILLSGSLLAQTFNDDFESYTLGSMIAATSDTWETWTSPNGGADDVAVTNNEAHSGSQSLYFSSTAANGGPADVVLPFPEEINVGQFNLDMWFYINPGAGAYFNLQETGVIGTSWAADVYFVDGTAQFTSGGSLLLECEYPEGSWFQLGMHNDMSTNTWDILINGNSQGTYANSATQIASMDIFPLQGNQFYVDDVSYSFEPYTLGNTNGAAVSINNINSGLAGQQATPSVTIRNLGTQAITSFDLNLAYNGSNLSETISGVNIPSLAFYTVDFSQSLTLAAGLNPASATISNINGAASDDDATDDTKTIDINPIVPAPYKAVVAEEATGTWCPWCVRGTVFMEELSNRYDGYFIGIAVHNEDPMVVTNYDSAIGGYISGYPSGLVDRGTEYDPSQFEIPFLERIQVSPKAIIENGASFDAASGVLSISASTTFLENVTGDYRIACVITEDGLSGTTSDWAQANAYAGGSNGDMGGYENLPNPVPAAQMVYDHVARFISPSFTGQPNAFAGAQMSGNTTTHNFTADVPDSWNLSNIHIICMVIGPDGVIDNATSTTFSEAETNGFLAGNLVLGTTELHSFENGITLFPNPASDRLMVKIDQQSNQQTTLRLTDAYGKTIEERAYNNLSSKTIFPIELDGLSQGMYFIQVIQNDRTFTKSFIKE
jgi:hypothetical protein